MFYLSLSWFMNLGSYHSIYNYILMVSCAVERAVLRYHDQSMIEEVLGNTVDVECIF